MAATNSLTPKREKAEPPPDPEAEPSKDAPPEESSPEILAAPDEADPGESEQVVPVEARDGSPPEEPPGDDSGSGGDAEFPPGPPDEPGERPPLTGARRVWVTNRGRGWLVLWLLKFYVYAAIIALLGAGIGGVMTYRYFASELPPLANIESYNTLAPGSPGSTPAADR